VSAGELLGLLMMAVMLGIIFVGFPISFTLLFCALGFGWPGLGLDQTFSLAYLQIWGTMKDDILPAVPLFIFMGFVVEQAGLMERLFAALRNMLASLHGALYLAVLLTATLFAMATGIVGAAVTVLGIIAGPIMVKSRYDPEMSAGALAAGGTLGILIPPSIMLVVMGPTLGVPVNLLYAGALGPGLLLAAMYIAYCLGRSFLNPKLGPSVPLEERIVSPQHILRELIVGVAPLFALIAFTLGTILGGLATATEAASCGALGATLLAAAYRKLSYRALKAAAISTMVTTSMVLFLAVASNVFGAVFANLGAAGLVTEAIDGLPLPDMGKLLLILGLIFLLGWPFEWPAIILVFVPIFLPVLEQLDMGLSRLDLLIWLGALVAVNLQTAFLSPPVAMSAYYLRNVMPAWSLATIYRGMAQFMVIQILCLLALLAWPQIALWLPRALQ
jgi:tripartite ATP-independent transporter DctM subunit